MKVHFDERGEGNPGPIVMIHGAGGSTATWFMQLKHLSHGFHVIAIDLNGHGKTVDRNEHDVFKSYLSDIETVVNQYDNIILCGHSMGGALTQLFALQDSSKLSGIILVGTGAKLRVNPMIFEWLENDFEAYIGAMGTYAFAEETDEEMREASKAEMRKCPPSIISRDFRACDAFDVMDRIHQISIPTLIVVGDEDLLTPPKYSTYLGNQIVDSKLTTIPKAGHSVMLEQREAFNSEIKDWHKAL